MCSKPRLLHMVHEANKTVESMRSHGPNVAAPEPHARSDLCAPTKRCLVAPECIELVAAEDEAEEEVMGV